MDGVGKSTICEMISKRTGFVFVDKPLRFLFNESGGYDEYIRIRDYVNQQEDHVFTAWFYGLASTYLYNRFNGQNIITDRHFVSNYMWGGDETSLKVFDTLIDSIGVPSLSVVLYARPDVIEERLRNRDRKDPDLYKVALSEKAYSKIEEFFERYDMPHIIIDTSDKTPEDVCDIIMDKLAKEGVI